MITLCLSALLTACASGQHGESGERAAAVSQDDSLSALRMSFATFVGLGETTGERVVLHQGVSRRLDPEPILTLRDTVDTAVITMDERQYLSVVIREAAFERLKTESREPDGKGKTLVLHDDSRVYAAVYLMSLPIANTVFFNVDPDDPHALSEAIRSRL